MPSWQAEPSCCIYEPALFIFSALTTSNPWAARYTIWLVIKLTPKDLVFVFLFWFFFIIIILLHLTWARAWYLVTPGHANQLVSRPYTKDGANGEVGVHNGRTVQGVKCHTESLTYIHTFIHFSHAMLHPHAYIHSVMRCFTYIHSSINTVMQCFTCVHTFSHAILHLHAYIHYFSHATCVSPWGQVCTVLSSSTLSSRAVSCELWAVSSAQQQLSMPQMPSTALTFMTAKDVMHNQMASDTKAYVLDHAFHVIWPPRFIRSGPCH